MIPAHRRDVALGCRILATEDQGGFDEMTADEVILVSWDGEVLEGDGRRHLEYPIHTELMRARPDVQAVVHTHAPWSVAFAATEEPLRPVSHEATLFVPPDVARFTETGDLVTTPQLGESLARTVGERNVALMVKHGIVASGGDLPTAVFNAVFLERACRTNMRALMAGGPKIWSSDEEALAKREHVYVPQAAWDYLARRLG